MALTPAQKAAIAPIVIQEGGLSGFFTSVQATIVTSNNTASLAALASVIVVTVNDWPALKAAIAAGTDAGLVQIRGAISSDVQANDATRLGPLLAGLYIAVMARDK